jgi:hypothetical protein
MVRRRRAGSQAPRPVAQGIVEVDTLPDTWINRLVVTGPVGDLITFKSSVDDPEAQPATMLSFRRLQTCLSLPDRQSPR